MPYSDPEAQKAAQRRHYEANTATYKARATRNKLSARQIRIEFVRAQKDRPCADCGGRFHYAVMEFDHVRGAKLGNVATMAHKGVSLERLKTEIEKCELVCANCHRLRTWSRLDIPAGL